MTKARSIGTAPKVAAKNVVALRRHAALARALLEELEHLVPSFDASAPGDIVAEQLIEELTRLAHRILECTATMTPSPEAPADFEADPERLLFPQRPPSSSSSRFQAAAPIPATE
jgi:hypothetical protein